MLSITTFCQMASLAGNRPFSKEAVNVFFQSLGVMWKGMAGIFGVILVFYIVIKILGRKGDING